MLTFNIEIIEELKTYWFIMNYYKLEYKDLYIRFKEFKINNIFDPLNSLQNWLGVSSEKEIKLLTNNKFYSVSNFFKRFKIENLYNEQLAINNLLYIIETDRILPKIDRLKMKFSLHFRYLIIKNLTQKLVLFRVSSKHKELIKKYERL